MIEENELAHDAGRCDAWTCEYDHGDDQGHRVRFVLPMLPMSVNSLYNFIYRQSRIHVVLKSECFTWKTKAKEYMPVFKVKDDSLVQLDATFTYPWHHKNGRLRKFDSPNLLKLLIDAISERIGVDDSRIKAGSWQSRDSQNESVTVTLTEITISD